MTATNFNTENRTYRQLIGNGLTYTIPPFQRDYSWTEEEWEDLWHDILEALPAGGEPAHYMGYLVLQTGDNRLFDVIDGQQRLTTLSLLVLASMSVLKKLVAKGHNADANQQRLTQLQASYIGYLDPVTLTSRNKLSLNRNNDSYYRDYLVILADHLPQRGFPASTHLLRKGFEWFERKLTDHVKTSIDQGMELARFVDVMSDRLFFTVITVADELNAYKVFETLNARGVRLSTTDLLKNWLFSVLAKGPQAQSHITDLERRWDSLVGRLGNESFPDFLRMHWNSRHGFARHAALFKAMREHIQTPEAVFALLRALDEDIEPYLALTQPEMPGWPPERQALAQDLRMFSVRQPYPMLLAAHRCLAPNDFTALLRATVILAFRYNVIGSQHTGEQEQHYHRAALKLHRGETSDLRSVLDTLRPIYRNDDLFKADFAEKTIKTTQSRNAKIVRYILAKLEKQVGGADIDPYASTYTIEHILPQNPESGWQTFTDRDLEHFTYRLANMVLLEAKPNRTIANRPYSDKQSVLQASTLALTRQTADTCPDWTPERLKARQTELAKLATACWRISQLSEA